MAVLKAHRGWPKGKPRKAIGPIQAVKKVDVNIEVLTLLREIRDSLKVIEGDIRRNR